MVPHRWRARSRRGLTSLLLMSRRRRQGITLNRSSHQRTANRWRDPTLRCRFKTMNSAASKTSSRPISIPRNRKTPNMPKKKSKPDSDRPRKRQMLKKLAASISAGWNWIRMIKRQLEARRRRDLQRKNRVKAYIKPYWKSYCNKSKIKTKSILVETRERKRATEFEAAHRLRFLLRARTAQQSASARSSSRKLSMNARRSTAQSSRRPAAIGKRTLTAGHGSRTWRSRRQKAKSKRRESKKSIYPCKFKMAPRRCRRRPPNNSSTLIYYPRIFQNPIWKPSAIRRRIDLKSSSKSNRLRVRSRAERFRKTSRKSASRLKWLRIDGMNRKTTVNTTFPDK